MGIMTERNATTYVLDVDGLEIEVVRKRVKNVNYRVGAGGQARMSVPWHVSRARAEQYARARIDWFREHIERVGSSQEGMAPRDWVTGETVCVWGEPAKLEVVESDGVPSCELAAGRLVLHVPSGTTSSGRMRFVEGWLRDELRSRLVELVPVYEKRVGVHAKSITLRRMTSRWGSCTASKGTIRLNTALAECPPACLEMVLVHELCHLLEANHGPRFHALMDLHCPSWRASKRWLNEHPPRVWRAEGVH